MRSIWFAVCLILISTTGFSQDNKAGGIFGLLSDQAARLVANAPIEARNVDTGAKFQTDSGETGLYKLNALPSGTYELSISVTGVGSFVQQRIKVTGTKPVRFDIILPLG
jgi:Carboxypeptidase regulatory-like domain